MPHFSFSLCRKTKNQIKPKKPCCMVTSHVVWTHPFHFVRSISMFNCSHREKISLIYRENYPWSNLCCCLLSCHAVLLWRQYLHLLCHHLVGIIRLQLYSTSVALHSMCSSCISIAGRQQSFFCDIPGNARWRWTITPLSLLPVTLLLKHGMGMALLLSASGWLLLIPLSPGPQGCTALAEAVSAPVLT